MSNESDTWNLKNALEFNKFTCTVNLAMIAYSLSVIKNAGTVHYKMFFSVVFILLILSFISGISVFGRAAKIVESVKDENLIKYARFHVFSLGGCCLFLGFYAFLNAWGVFL